MQRRHQPMSRARLGVENLEGRALMAGITANLDYRGVLHVSGSEGGDSIYISQTNGRLAVHGVATFNANSVRAIAASGRGGSDTIEVLGPNGRSGGQFVTKPTVIDGGSGHDRLVGGAVFDLIYGGTGDDDIFGQEGSDLLVGGDGNDELYGWTGNDYLFGGWGDDYLVGAYGNDYLDGGANWDTLYGGDGNDALLGGAGFDTLYGNSGTNYLIDTWYQYTTDGYDFHYNTLYNQVYQPTFNYQPSSPTALQSILGPDLYNGIFVNHTIPNYFRNTA